jgi:ring-1,2-phenylacetyl-CoA epoxidase subunit PaaC
VSARAQLLLEIADDELIVGWRDSEWTGIAPTLEEDVAFSSIAQNEIGHARAAYELAARDLGTDADALAFDRRPEEYRCAPFVELRLLEWAPTIARRYLYEAADAVRLGALIASDDADVAGLAAKIEREEAYHRIHAELWHERLRDEPRYRDALDRLWPYALGMLPENLRPRLTERLGAPGAPGAPGAVKERGEHTPELADLWEEMTSVRRSAPGAEW